MLLERLSEIVDRGDPSTQLPPLYEGQPIRYLVELDRSGGLRGPRPVDTADPATPANRRGTRHPAPVVQRANAIKPLLLADNSEYSFGLAREGSRPERVRACHEAYRALVRECADETRDPLVTACLRFLEDRPETLLSLPPDFDRGALLSFRVDGQWVIDRSAVQDFWARHNDPALQQAPIMQCLVCGERRPVLERLQKKLKGVPGGQTSGTSLISANANAYESYGQPASLVAPTCARCGERFTRGLNALLGDPASRIVLGGTVFVFWTRDATSPSFMTLLSQPAPELVRDLLASVREGGHSATIDQEAFYGLALSGSGGRAVVRDWIDTTVGGAKRNVSTWFSQQRIAGPYGEEHHPVGLYALAAATVRDPRTDLRPPVPRALLHAALTGSPLPWDVLYQAVRRARADRSVDHARAALIKLVLQSNGAVPGEEGAMTTLTTGQPDPAYHCGRLLAVLEEIQRAAMPGVKASIVDRFYGTASTAPGSVFARLIRGAQPHLGRLERDRPGAYVALQQRLEEVQSHLSDFPRTLNLRDQGLFALGYYHQRASDRTAAHAGAERRRAADDEAPAAKEQ